MSSEAIDVFRDYTNSIPVGSTPKPKAIPSKEILEKLPHWKQLWWMWQESKINSVYQNRGQ